MSDPIAPAITPSTPATPSVAPASPVATPQVTSPVAATPATPQVPATGTPEDRSNWVPPHRIRETREAAQREFATREAQYQADLQRVQNQLRAVMGFTPPQDPEVDAIKQRFGEVFPGLSRIEQQAEQLEQYMERIADLEAAVDHIWKNHGRQSMDRIFKQAEDSLGSPLSDDGKRALHAAFSGWVQSNPEYQQRYVDDPELVNEFWKTLSSTLVDPARRAAAVATASRVPPALPQDRPAGVPAPSPAPKPNGLQERAELAWTQFQQERNR